MTPVSSYDTQCLARLNDKEALRLTISCLINAQLYRLYPFPSKPLLPRNGTHGHYGHKSQAERKLLSRRNGVLTLDRAVVNPDSCGDGSSMGERS